MGENERFESIRTMLLKSGVAGVLAVAAVLLIPVIHAGLGAIVASLAAIGGVYFAFVAAKKLLKAGKQFISNKISQKEERDITYSKNKQLSQDRTPEMQRKNIPNRYFDDIKKGSIKSSDSLKRSNYPSSLSRRNSLPARFNSATSRDR